MANKRTEIVKCITISSSDDENDCMPKIIDTVSLQGPQGKSLRKYDVFSKTPNELVIPPKPSMDIRAHIRKPNTIEPKRITPNTVQVYHSVSKKPEAPITVVKNDGSEDLFKKFCSACQKLGTSSEVTAKICDKVVRAYKTTAPAYISSDSFKTLLKTSIHGILNSTGTKPWHIVRSVVDELKHHKISKKNKKLPDLEKGKGNSGDFPGEGTSKDAVNVQGIEVDYEVEELEIKDPKKRRQVRKLESTLRKLDRRIKQLEEREIGLEDMDDEDSAYIKLDKYKAHFTKVYKRICELAGKSSDAERTYLRKVSFGASPYPEINRCLEIFYNKKREFPDFQDVKKLVQNVNVTKKMRWPPIKVHDIAEKTFKDFGEMLKRMRQYDDYEVMSSYLSSTNDPAKQSSELRQKLLENAVLSKKREQEVIDSFANKQMENLGKEKGSNISDSNSATEQDSSSEDEDKCEEFSESDVGDFKDDFKSEEETIEDPKHNFTNYLELQPNKRGCTSADNETKNEVDIELPDNKLERFDEQNKSNLSSAVEESDASSYKRKLSLLSSDGSGEEETKIHHINKKKKLLSKQSSLDEKGTLRMQEKYERKQVSSSEENKVKVVIKTTKHLLEELILSDDSSRRRRKIKLSIGDSSDDERESINDVKEDSLSEEQSDLSEIKEKSIEHIFEKRLTHLNKGEDINIVPTKHKQSEISDKKDNVDEKIIENKDEEDPTTSMLKYTVLPKSCVNDKIVVEKITDSDKEKMILKPSKNSFPTDSLENDNSRIKPTKMKIELLANKFSSESEDNEESNGKERKIKLSKPTKKKRKLFKEDNCESTDNEGGSIKKRKIKLSIGTSSEDEIDHKEEKENKIRESDENCELDQEYVLPRNKKSIIKENILKVRPAKKIVQTPIYNRRYNKKISLSKTKQHSKDSDGDHNDNLYKISVHNLNRQKIITDLPETHVYNFKTNSHSVIETDIKKSHSSDIKQSQISNARMPPSKYKQKTSSSETNNLPKANKKEFPDKQFVHNSVSSSTISNSNESETTDCRKEISYKKLENKNKDSIKKNISPCMNLDESDSNDIKEIMINDKKDENAKLESKFLESDCSSEEKDMPMPLEDSDYGIDEREDTDDGTPTKFIIKKTVLTQQSEDSNDASPPKFIIKKNVVEKSKNIEKHYNFKGKDKESDSRVESKNHDGTAKNKQKDSNNSDLDDSIVIISEDILDEREPDKNKIRSENKTIKLPNDNSSKSLKYTSSMQKHKSNSNKNSCSDSDSELNEQVLKLCEVNISDSEPEAVNIDDESSDLSDSNTKKPTTTTTAARKRKEPTPELCIIMESSPSKQPVLQHQRRKVIPMSSVVQNSVARMPLRKPTVNPLIRPSFQRNVNPGPVIRPSSVRSLNPTYNRRMGFNPLSSSTPVHLPQQRFNNQNVPNKVIVNKPATNVSRRLYTGSPAKTLANKAQAQVPQPSNVNRKLTNGNVQRNVNINFQQIVGRPQNTKVVPAEEDIIVLD